MTGQRMKSEEEASIQRFEHVIQDHRIAPDKAHGRNEEGEAVEGNDTVRRIHYSLICFT